MTAFEILSRAKGIAAFLGSLLTFATATPSLELPLWVTGVAALLTFVGAYVIPNATVRPDLTAGTGSTTPGDQLEDEELEARATDAEIPLVAGAVEAGA